MGPGGGERTLDFALGLRADAFDGGHVPPFLSPSSFCPVKCSGFRTTLRGLKPGKRYYVQVTCMKRAKGRWYESKWRKPVVIKAR